MKQLFEFHRIGPLTVKNRVCCPPMVTFHWSQGQGMANDRHVRHYQSIAKGGQGLIVQEATCVSPTALLDANQLGIWSDEHIPGLKAITEAVHREGCPILLQIHHAGLWGSQERHVGPVRFAPTISGRLSDALDTDGIEVIEQQFVEAALRAVEAGYDGVELHGCHRYLFCSFLNAEVNRRTDAYGHTPTLIVTETLEKVRAAVGPGFIIGVRMGGFEPEWTDGVANARILAGCGADYLSVSNGFDRHGHYAEGFEDYDFDPIFFAAEKIKKAVGVPVFAVNGVRSAETARRILGVTDIDMVCVGRGILVNYEWADEARAGVDVGRCLDCVVCQWRLPDTRCPGRILHDRKKSRD